MEKDKNRYRTIQIKFWVTSEERDQLDKNMRQAGYEKIGSYLLKMGLQGFVVNVDFSDVRAALGDVGDLRSELNKIGNNINQISKHTNEVKEFDVMDFYLLQEEFKSIKKLIEDFDKEVAQTFRKKIKEMGVE